MSKPSDFDEAADGTGPLPSETGTGTAPTEEQQLRLKYGPLVGPRGAIPSFLQKRLNKGKHFDSGDYAMARAGAAGSKQAGGAGGTVPETGETETQPPVVNKPPATSGGVPPRRVATATSSKLVSHPASASAPPAQLEVGSAGCKVGEFSVSPVTPTSPTSTSPTGGAPALTHEAVLAKRQALGLNPALLSRAAPGTSKLSPSAPPVSGLALFESFTQP